MDIVARNEADVKVNDDDGVGSQVLDSIAAEHAIRERVGMLLAATRRRSEQDAFFTFGRFLFREVLLLGRLFLQFFLALAHERLDVPARSERGRAKFERQGPKARTLRTACGPVRYQRFYMHKKNGSGGGYFPLDETLGLTADRFGLQVLSWATQLATRMSYAAAASVFAGFLGWAPSTKTIEKAALGFGAYAEPYLDGLPAPEDDGETLIIQIDGKGIPTATESELEKRRGKRRTNRGLKSPRHRGRDKRRRWGPRPRRSRGDKSKNAKLFHVIVLYTLRSDVDETGERILAGPIGKRIYVSGRTKRQAVRRARKLANRRGFSAKSKKSIQIVTDGDQSYADAIAEFFPEVVQANRHTLDMLHAIEYLWEAAFLLEPDDQAKREAWVAERKSEMCCGAIDEVLHAMRARLNELDDDEPSDTTSAQRSRPKGRSKKRKTPRQKLRDIIAYLQKRTHMMNYGLLGSQDLEWATGVVEGAVRYVVGQRFDEAGMRWIKERSAALAHLRCIQINGVWSGFIEHVHQELMNRSRRSKSPPRLLTNTPPPLT